MGYRIFLSYRENSGGKEFVRKLFDRIRSTPRYADQYGEPYFSSENDRDKNFLEIHLEGIEYFVIPYTKGFFNRRSGTKPVIFMEIEEALRQENPVHFIPVVFPGFDMSDIAERYREILDPSLLDRLNHLVGAKFDGQSLDVGDRTRYRTEEDFEAAVQEQEQKVMDRVLGILHIAENNEPNVYMTTKQKIEEEPLFVRLDGVKKITFLNYAGTSFISGASTADTYLDDVRGRFYKMLLSGKIEVEMVLTEPGSAADIDASHYKMNGGNVKTDVYRARVEDYKKVRDNYEKIGHVIQYNFNKIAKFKLDHPEVKISIYSTDIALPYSLMKCEYEDSGRDSMQLCLYVACMLDEKRPAFRLYKNDPATGEVYSIFEESLRHIMQCAVPFNGHPDVSFMLDRNRFIVHRAKLGPEAPAMTREAVRACAEKGYAFEVDALFVGDEIAVWRDEPMGKYSGFTDHTNFAQLNNVYFRRVRRQLLDGQGYSQIMTLPEMIDLLEETAKKQGTEPVPLELEIKDHWETDEDTVRCHAIRVCNLMRHYHGKYIIVAANPNVLRAVKDYDIRIPCGMITMDFEKSRYADVVSEEYKKIHKEAGFYSYVIPDLVFCRIGDFNYYNDPMCNENLHRYGLKKIGWTARTEEEYWKYDDKYDNLVIEYDPEP